MLYFFSVYIRLLPVNKFTKFNSITYAQNSKNMYSMKM